MKRILVLGATSGIGRALVVLLRQEGYEVIAAGRRRSLLESLGGEILELDVTAEDAVERAATVGADTVIFNAGYGERTPMPDGVRTDRALAVNVLAFERFARWALTSCECFVGTASIAGIRGLENTNGYSPSKAYMINALEGYRRKARQCGLKCRYVYKGRSEPCRSHRRYHGNVLSALPRTHGCSHQGLREKDCRSLDVRMKSN